MQAEEAAAHGFVRPRPMHHMGGTGGGTWAVWEQPPGSTQVLASLQAPQHDLLLSEAQLKCERCLWSVARCRTLHPLAGKRGESRPSHNPMAKSLKLLSAKH